MQLFQQAQKDKKTANEGFSLFNLDFNHLMENLKTMMNLSKYEALRKTLLWKIKSLKSMLFLKEVWKISLEQEKMVKLTIEGIWKDLANVELLRNFEETEEYCCKQIENSPELKFKEIWMKYRDGNRKAKNQFETSVDSICL